MTLSDSFQISLPQLISILSATSHNFDLNRHADYVVNTISTDSRNLQPGDLFLALKGENFDGHSFVGKAIAKGAKVAVVSQLIDDFPQILVPDTLIAYQLLAKWWRTQTDLPVIAITGSAGKTTTKELIAAMLSYFTPNLVHKSVANFNNDIGVAQTLLAIAPQNHDYVVVEMGMRGKGEIARLAQTALPNISVITNIGTAHIGRLGSQIAIAEAKCELLAEMPNNGIAILNGEDHLLLEIAAKHWQGKTLTYGIVEDGVGEVGRKFDIQGKLSHNSLELNSLEAYSLEVDSRTWQLPLSGRHNALNFLAGLSVLRALELDWQLLPNQITTLSMPDGRAEIDFLEHDIVILDQTYNASPEATIAALSLLSQTPANRRWAILGANRELGSHSYDLHFQIGKQVKELGIDFLVVLVDLDAEPETKAILIGAERSDYIFQNVEAIAQFLVEQVLPGDCLLFKASHSVRMDQAVALFKQLRA